MTLNVVIFMTSPDGVQSLHFKFNEEVLDIIEGMGQTKYPMVIIKLVK